MGVIFNAPTIIFKWNYYLTRVPEKFFITTTISLWHYGKNCFKFSVNLQMWKMFVVWNITIIDKINISVLSSDIYWLTNKVNISGTFDFFKIYT